LTATTASRLCTADDAKHRPELLPHGKTISVKNVRQGRLLKSTGSALGEFSKGCASCQRFLLLHTRKERRRLVL